MSNNQVDRDPQKIAIIGGGIGGLTAALALLRRGMDVDVYEQSAELKEVGAGIHISANGTRVMDALGLEAPLARVQFIPERRELRHWQSGETWQWFELGKTSLQRARSRADRTSPGRHFAHSRYQLARTERQCAALSGASR